MTKIDISIGKPENSFPILEKKCWYLFQHKVDKTYAFITRVHGNSCLVVEKDLNTIIFQDIDIIETRYDFIRYVDRLELKEIKE